MSNSSGILVIAEVSGNALASISTEVLGAARRLADQTGQPVQAALLGSGVEGLAKDLVAFGADQVYVVDDPLLAKYSTDGYLAAIEKVNAQARPRRQPLQATAGGGDDPLQGPGPPGAQRLAPGSGRQGGRRPGCVRRPRQDNRPPGGRRSGDPSGGCGRHRGRGSGDRQRRGLRGPG